MMDSRILVVDDCKPVHALIRSLINAPGMELFSAYTGMRGLELARRVAPNLILLDVDLPDINGFEVCCGLKANFNTRASRVMFITASRSADEQICGMQLEADDYITKPFNVAELVLRTENMLAKSCLPRSAPDPDPFRQRVSSRYSA